MRKDDICPHTTNPLQSKKVCKRCRAIELCKCCPICDSQNITEKHTIFKFNYPEGLVQVATTAYICLDCREEWLLCGQDQPDIFAIAMSARQELKESNNDSK